MVAQDLKALLPRAARSLRPLGGATVLVTGASGMIAAYLVDAIAAANATLLAANPARLVVVTRRPVAPGSRLGHLLGRPDVSCLTADVGQPFDLPDGITHIVHAASWADPKRYLAHPIETLDVNALGARHLLQYAVGHRVAGFLLVSSAEVYGAPDQVPTPETYVGRVDPIGPRSAYAEAKRFAECLAVHFHRVRAVPAVIARLFHVYGPGQPTDDSRVTAAFLRYALAGRDIEVFNEGRDRRTLCYVADAAAALLNLLTAGQPGEAYNVGVDTPEVSTRELAELVAEEFGHTVKVRNYQDPTKQAYLAGAPSRVAPDVAKLRALGWAPQIGLAEGIHRLRQWWQSST